jgi:hypothetical protein
MAHVAGVDVRGGGEDRDEICDGGMAVGRRTRLGKAMVADMLVDNEEYERK